jgi:hypothetical protein
MERPISIGAGLICVLIHRSAGRASLGRIFQDSDWLRDGPMRRIGALPHRSRGLVSVGFYWIK